jgi:hypothetical protein
MSDRFQVSGCEQVWPIMAGDDGFKFTDHLALDGTSLDLEGATVELVIRDAQENLLAEWPATVLQEGDDQDDTLPNVECAPSAGGLTQLGTHDLQWRVTFAGGTHLTYPRGKPHKIRVYETLKDWE